MKIIFHGAAYEVGRSCIDVISDNSRILLDAGIKFSEDTSGELHGPVQVTDHPIGLKNLENVDAVFVSHAHLDHTGELPILVKKGLECPIFVTGLTKSTSNILLQDSYKISKINHKVEFSKDDLFKSISLMSNANYGKGFNVGGIKAKYYDAGHIPGSSSILLNIDGKKLFYTGDIKLSDTLLLDKAKYIGIEDENVDIMIIECTYGKRSHPDRKKQEQEFLAKVKEGVKKGSVMIAVFAVGRAQEILLLMNQLKVNVPVYLDGMSIKVTREYFKKSKFVKDEQALSEAFGNVYLVKGRKERSDIMKSKGVFITTSGMLTGGPIMDYMKHLAGDSRNTILLTGYQAEGSNGRNLLEKGYVIVDDKKIKVNAKFQQFDFSAHAGSNELQDLIKRVKPKDLILNHGDKEEIDALALFAKDICNVHTPKLGDIVEIN